VEPQDSTGHHLGNWYAVMAVIGKIFQNHG
jgi:hypothetical protein